METEENITELTRIRLKILFRLAYNGRVDINRVYEKGLEIKNRLDDFLRDANLIPKSISDVFNFIEQLHDSSARQYNSENKEQIYYHLRTLQN